MNPFDELTTEQLCDLSIDYVHNLSPENLIMLDTVLQRRKEEIEREIISRGVPYEWVSQLIQLTALLELR
jgi:hypothetical protein